MWTRSPLTQCSGRHRACTVAFAVLIAWLSRVCSAVTASPHAIPEAVGNEAWPLRPQFGEQAVEGETAALNRLKGVQGQGHEQEQDPVTSLRILFPKNGTVEKLPLTFRGELGVENVEQYTARYADMKVCMEIQGMSAMCSPVLDSDIVFDDLPSGSYTGRAFLTDADGVVRHHQTDDVFFSIVTSDVYAAQKANLIKRSREALQLPTDVDICQWAEQQQPHTESQVDASEDRVSLESVVSSRDGMKDPVLVIGVKSAVLTNFLRRQAIRETWGSRSSLPRGVKVVFLGCVPNYATIPDARDQKRFQQAVRLERVVYGDLLTDELDCEDAYAHLADKVKAFLHLTATTFPQTPFVMIADDDIYLRVDQLLTKLHERGSHQRLYIGQSWSSLSFRRSCPVRDEKHRNYLSKMLYPLSELPPFAFGPHYVMSMDCVRFISKNYWRLRTLSALDDVSVALWLLTIQVHLEHEPDFYSLNIQSCEDRGTSFAELMPLGIRALHANLLHHRGVCHGFDQMAWRKSDPLASLENQRQLRAPGVVSPQP
ncbi:hypothetical protein BBJ28_00008553 [Nothophytophthora sp. Chile5]|nr:hypothetical protein BBJ28_00008553 [Nothophytophthora sp. Chile5]